MSSTVGVHAQFITRLAPETNQAFDQYVKGVEPAISDEARGKRRLPWLGDEALVRVRDGEIVIRGITERNGTQIRGGLVHDWAGGMFIAGATLGKTAGVLQDFAHHQEWYPEIIDSRLLSRDGSNVRGSWTLLKKNVLTVVLRVELTSEYRRVSSTRAHIVSRTEPIVEITDQGTPKQAEYPPGQGHGFLWRFNGYWNIQEGDGGVYAVCRVVSLSRDVPLGLGWAVNPFIRSMPRESVESTLKHTREALTRSVQ